MSIGGMAPSQSKAQADRKTSREKKVNQKNRERTDVSQKMHVKESKSQDRRRMRRESPEQTSSEDASSDSDMVAPAVVVRSAAKSKREVKLNGGRERSFAKVTKEKRDSKSKDVHSGRRHGEQFMYKGEEKAERRRPRLKDQNTRHHVSTRSNESKDMEDWEKCDFKRKHKGQQSKRKNVPDTESFTAESEEGDFWKQESHWKRNPVETAWIQEEKTSREQQKVKSHCQARSKLPKSQVDGYREKHMRKLPKIVSKASLVPSEDSSCSDSHVKYKNPNKGNRKTGKTQTKCRVGSCRSFEDEEEICDEKQLWKSQHADDSNGHQELHETTSGSKGKLEVIVERQEAQDEESDSEINEDLKRMDKGKPAPSESDAGRSSENHSRGSMEEESDDNKCGNSSEKGSVREGSDCEQSKLRTKKGELETTILAKTESNRDTLQPGNGRTKLLKVDLGEILQGNHQGEENMNTDDKTARTKTTCSALQLQHKSQSHGDPDISKPSACSAQANPNGGPSSRKNQVDVVALLAKSHSHLTSHSQILMNLRRKHKDAKAELLTRGKLVPAPPGTEIVSDLEKTHSSHSNKRTTRSNKRVTKIKESPESRSSLSNSSNSNTRNHSPMKKKRVGKASGNMASCKVLEGKEEEEEVIVEQEEPVGKKPARKDLASTKTRSKPLHTLSTFQKVTHWLSHKPLKKMSLKDRFLSLARAIGISGWILKTFGQKKRRSKPFGFRRRMAIRIVSTTGLAKRCNRTSSRDSAGEQLKENLCSKGLLESDQGGDRETYIVEEQEEAGEVAQSIFLCNKNRIPSQTMPEEEKNYVAEAKFAIVLPRVHQLVKSKNASLRSSGSEVHNQSRRAIMSVQRGCKFQHDLPIPSGNSHELLSSPQADASIPVEEVVQRELAPSSLEKDAEDMADLNQRHAPEAMDQVHWTQHQAHCCDPMAWLNSETLLPRLTVENLSKWTLNQEQDLAQSHRSKNASRGRWETEDILEMDMAPKQIYRNEDCYIELEKVEDLSRLEDVCESSVLLCLKRRFHCNFIYTYIGHILVFVNPFKPLSLYSEDMIIQYQKSILSGNAPHIFAIAEMAYALSQSSEKEQCIVISGHSGSGKTETAKAIVLYLTRLYQGQESNVKKQLSDILPILESFGNAKTILNDNSSRFGKFLNVHLKQGLIMGIAISQHLLEKSRVVFHAHGERNFHVFYELLAGLPIGQKEELYLQEPETYFYLNQGRVCELSGKQDDQDFLVLMKALHTIGLSEEHLTSIWAILAGILQLGNICFTSCEKDSFELAVISSETEIQIVANLLHISSDLLQRAITHRVTETCYDRIVTPLSVESAIDARDAISKVLYSLLFDWLLLMINEWLAPLEMDSTIGIADVYGFEDLGANSLEQLCINFASEHLQHYFSQIVITQEEEEYTQEELIWSPVSNMSTTVSCLDLIAAKPYGILHILDDQTLLLQATDHTFLQKCHYHHANSPWYIKPKLPLPVFTVQHYAGAVTYQVHKFLNKNHDELRPEILDIFSQSHLKLVSSLFQRVKHQQTSQRKTETRGQGLKNQASTLVSRFQQSLQDLTAKLDRSHIFFVRCIKPNAKKLPNIFDTEYVSCQLRLSGILEAICIRKEGYPIRIPFQYFLIRYGALAGQGQNCLQGRDGCATVLSNVVGDLSELYQIGITKVFLKEKARQMLERQWNQKLNWAIVTLQRNLRCLINRRRLQVFKQKATIIQAHFRGYIARKRYRQFRKTLLQFGVTMLVSRPVIHRRKQYQDVQLLEIPAELAALLHLAEDHNHSQPNQVTEVSPPEVKARADLSLPPDINSFPFSSFIRSHFQEVGYPPLGQPLQQPLTRLDVKHRQSALQLNKLILRFIHDKNLHGWQEELLGNYIVSHGLSSHSLRNELLSQVASQVWKNSDLEQCQRGWILMAALLGSFTPSPALEKPLLKFVSDHGLEGYNGVCQRKLLTAMKQTESYPGESRAFPPTQLEWTTNQRKGKMVLDVYTYKEERVSAEVESWTTGEQYAGWILSSRGLDKVPRGWSVSMFTGKLWQDLPGCDFVLDLIGELEEGRWSTRPSPDYPITPELHEDYSQRNSVDNRTLLDIPPAPGVQAPAFPPPSLPPDLDHVDYAAPMTRSISRSSNELDYFVDDLFMSLLHNGSRAHLSDMENEGSLTGRMKGGGKIGPTQQGPFSGYSGMMHMPAYHSMPAMGGMMPTTMPVMPGLGGMGSMPAMVLPQPVMPSVDPSQLAAQQQAFINQQALLMAQQMTLQAMTISQQQQEQQRLPRGRSSDSSRTRQEPLRRSSPESPRPRRASPRRRSPELSRSRHVSQRRWSPEPSQPSPTRVLTQEISPEPSRQRQTSPQSLPSSAPELQRLNSSKRDVSIPKAPESPPRPSAPIHIYQEKHHSDVKADTISLKSVQKKIDYFQRMGQETNHIKNIAPSSKRWSPPRNLQSENQNSSPELNSDLAMLSPVPKGNVQEMNANEDHPPVIKASALAQKSEPSQEIRNVIKTHKSQPIPPPKPIMPLRKVSKPFVKKSDPKEEALTKLGIVGLCPSPTSSASPERSPGGTSPRPQQSLPPQPPGKLSSSIREKQLPLMNLFARSPTSPPNSVFLPPPPPSEPPPPAPSSPSVKATEEAVLKGSARTMVEDTGVKTLLFNQSASVSFSYANPIWKLFLRKEVFYPKENFSHPYCLNLLCDQIVRDTYSESCIRISKEERRKMKDLLTEFQVGLDASSIQEDGIKKRIVVAARDNWASYFSRFFPVKGENGSDVQILGVSHRGLQLMKRAKAGGFSPEHLKILCSYRYADVLSLGLTGSSVLQFSLKNEQLILHSPKAHQIKDMVELFLHELRQDSNYVIALRSYITDDKSLLSFKKDDFIRLLPMEGLESGWQFGSVGGRSGLFPSSLVQAAAAPDYHGLHMNRQEDTRKSLRRNTQNLTSSLDSEVIGADTNTALSLDTCHYTMEEYATTHFQLMWKGMSTEEENPALLVKHTKVPIEKALLFYSDGEMNELATKSFRTLMRFMRDQPRLRNQSEVDCVYEILQLCKEKENLQDEIYCQVIKQITQNPNNTNCFSGWQLLSLLTGYFLPSNTLMPYATKYLQQASSDSTSPFTEIARVCQTNLRKMVMYGGRRHLPFHAEMEAFLKGRGSRQTVVNLSGDVKYNTKIKTFTVAAELLNEICDQIGVTEPAEVQEFAIFVSKDNGKIMRPLHQKDYIHDYLLQESSIRLEFQRITWQFPLHFENAVYINIHYSQNQEEPLSNLLGCEHDVVNLAVKSLPEDISHMPVLQNYMEGKLQLQHSGRLVEQVGTFALLQHWAKGAGSIPSMQELIQYIPEHVAHLINAEDVQAFVISKLETIKPLEKSKAKISFIEHMTQMPLFGYNVYPVERISIPGLPKPSFVGVNQEQLVVADGQSQKLHCLIPLKEMQRIQTLRPLDVSGIPGVEINYGSAVEPKTVWFELNQAKALYHTIAIFTEETESKI